MSQFPTATLPPLRAHESLDQAGGDHDALIFVGPAPLSRYAGHEALRAALAQAERIDASLGSERPSVHCLPGPGLAGERLIASIIGDWQAWEQDPRMVAAAAAAAMNRAIQAGARSPLLLTAAPPDARFERASEVALLGALGALWEPLELRLSGERPPRVSSVGVVAPGVDVGRLRALELGRAVARDICGTEPELMAPERVADYCEKLFDKGPVRVSVERDATAIAGGYPLLAAVARASLPVQRHHPRVVRLEYTPEGPVERTLFFAGKGLTYDTGGADLKTDGSMAGMSRDKGGAAAIAGLLEVCAERRPRGVRVVALLGVVRNSVGSDSFVTDEIIRARSGVRVRIGNTDAEGRLVLADLLSALREEAEAAVSPALFSVATLTGHAAIAFGPCTALVPNGRAAASKLLDPILRASDLWGDPAERSRLRPEDYAFIAPKSPAEDVISCNSLPSSRTPRGHQFPAAFLDVVSGLRALDRRGGLPYVHVDIAGSAVGPGGWAAGVPTGAPVLSFAEGLGLLLPMTDAPAELASWLRDFVAEPRFLARYPLYAGVLARLRPVEDPSTEVMAVSHDDGRFYLHVNVGYFQKNPLYLVGVLLHEVHHVVLGHLTHPKFRGVAHPDLMEIAMEISANEYIEEPLPGGILLRDYERMGLRPHQSTMQRYQRLVDLRQQGQLKLPAQLRFTDEHRRGPPAGAQVAVQNLIEEALRDQPEPSDPSLRLAGKHPAALIEQLSPGNAPRRPLDWRTALRMFTARHRAPRHSYARPSRRFPGRVGEIPGRVYTSREIEQPELLVALDTSASVDAATLDEIARQLAALSAHARFSVVECDAQIHRVYRFTGRLDAVMGRGGTDLRPPFDPAFLRAHRAQGIIYFTDGDGPFPEQPPALPALWVLSGKLDFACAWGQQVRMLQTSP